MHARTPALGAKPQRRRRFCLATLSLVLALGCNHPPGLAPPADRVLIVQGDRQLTEVSDTLRVPPVVEVVDQRGRPVAGVAVSFRVVEGGGSIEAVPALSRADGRVAARRWVLGPEAGLNVVEARVEGLAPARFTATGLAVRQIALGFAHTCVLVSDGRLECWGLNYLGQVGVGDTGRLVPGRARIPGGPYQSVVARAFHTCALDTSEVAYCWGAGALGDTFPSWSPTPVPVPGGHRFTRLWTGEKATCGLSPGGITYCWGAVGSDTLLRPPTPIGIDSVADVSFGFFGRICVVKLSGAALCLPQDPVLLGASDYRQIVQGCCSICGVSRSLGVVCQLAYPLTSPIVRVPLPGALIALDETEVYYGVFGGAVDSACAALAVGSVYCWGAAPYSGVPPGPPAQRLPGSEWLRGTQVSMTSGVGCLVTRQGSGWCWGNNTFGQLGDGTTQSSPTPIRVRIFRK